LDGDGRSEIVTGAGPGGGPHARTFRGDGSLAHEFFAYDTAFRGGVTVAAADADGDGKSEVVTGAGPGGGPHVRTFRGPGPARDPGFFALDGSFLGGVFVG